MRSVLRTSGPTLLCDPQRTRRSALHASVSVIWRALRRQRRSGLKRRQRATRNFPPAPSGKKRQYIGSRSRPNTGVRVAPLVCRDVIGVFIA